LREEKEKEEEKLKEKQFLEQAQKEALKREEFEKFMLSRNIWLCGAVDKKVKCTREGCASAHSKKELKEWEKWTEEYWKR
jgi:hypothetical protein